MSIAPKIVMMSAIVPNTSSSTLSGIQIVTRTGSVR